MFRTAIPPLVLIPTLLAEPCARQQADAAHPVEPVPVRCSYADWSAPQPIDGAPQRHVAWPSLAVRDGRGYVVGNDIPSFDEDTPVGKGPLIALALGGGSIGKPAGDFAFAFPRAVLDEAGVLHVVWGEPAGPHPRTAQEWRGLGYLRLRLGSLWYAMYDSVRGWTVPERLYVGGAVIWAHPNGSIALDPADRIHAAVRDAEVPGVVGERADADRLIHFVRERGSWYRNLVLTSWGPAVYTSMSAAPAGRIYVAYIAPDRTARRDLGSVFLTRSLDGGASWEPHRPIDRPGPPRRPVEVTVHATRDGVLHLVWSQNESALQGGSVRHTESHDGGKTWLPSAPLEPAEGFHTLQAVADRCGTVHVTFMRWSSHPAHDNIVSELWYARRDTAWTAPRRLFPDLSVAAAALAAAPTGWVHLFVSGRPAARGGSTPYVPMVAELPIAASAARAAGK